VPDINGVRANHLQPLWRNICPWSSNNTSTDHWPVTPPNTRSTMLWGSFPSTIDTNLRGSCSLSQPMPAWMVTLNSKLERSMSIGSSPDGGGGSGDGDDGD
jgi:hypothetical protein